MELENSGTLTPGAALLVGGASEIGIHLTRLLSEEGKWVHILETDERRVAPALQSLESELPHIAHRLDLQSTQSCARFRQWICQLEQPFEQLILLPPDLPTRPMTDMDARAFRNHAVIAENTFLLTRTVMQRMKAAGHGSVVALRQARKLGSECGLTSGHRVFSSGLHDLTNAIANELVPYGVTFNCIEYLTPSNPTESTEDLSKQAARIVVEFLTSEAQRVTGRRLRVSTNAVLGNHKL